MRNGFVGMGGFSWTFVLEGDLCGTGAIGSYQACLRRL